VSITYPLDLVRARLAFQVKTKRYSGVFNTISTLVKEDGIRGVYRGFVPTFMGILPYAGTSFYTYDTLKLQLVGHFPDTVLTDEGQLRVPFRLGIGMVAGLTAQVVSYPLDVVRRRMQLSGQARSIPLYPSVASAFRSIISTEGFRGLYVGLSINFVKVCPAVATSFATYEFIKRQLGIEERFAKDGKETR
jgi:solute carrier family 25 (mitochondrial phosphate transporter), member 23/24/25/41